jgi:hypothetical protein
MCGQPDYIESSIPATPGPFSAWMGGAGRETQEMAANPGRSFGCLPAAATRRAAACDDLRRQAGQALRPPHVRHNHYNVNTPDGCSVSFDNRLARVADDPADELIHNGAR